MRRLLNHPAIVRDKLQTMLVRLFPDRTQRRTLLGALAGIVGRATSIGAALVSVGVFSRLLSTTDFGAWMVLLAFFTLLTSQDLGVCSSLRVRLARHQLAGNDAEAKADFLTVLWGLITVVATCCVVMVLWRPSPSVLGIPSSYAEATYCIFACGLLQLVSAAVWHSMYAYLEANLVGGMDALRSLGQICAAGVAWVVHPDFFFAAMIFYLPWLLYAPTAYRIFTRRRGWRSDFAQLTWAVTLRGVRRFGEIFVGGLKLWALQLLMLALTATDVVMTGRFLSLESAAEVSVVLRLLNVAVGFLSVVMTSFLGTYAHEFGRGNTAWIRRALKLQMLSVGGLSFVVMIGLLTVGHAVVLAWTGRSVDDVWLFFWCGLSFTAYSLVIVLQTPFQGTASVSKVIMPLLLFAGLKVSLAYLLSRSFGAVGIMAGGCIANFGAGIVLAVQLRALIRAQTAQVSSPPTAESRA